MASALQRAASLLASALVGVTAALAAPALGDEPETPVPTPPQAAPAPEGPPDSGERDLLEVIGLRRQHGGGQPRRGEPVFFFLPAFGVNPNVGLSLGAGVSGAVMLGSPENTIMSSLTGSVQVTTKKQLLTSLKSIIVTPGNAWELLGDFRLFRFAEPTYGLGTGPTPVSEGFTLNDMVTAALPGGQPMTFRYVKVHETAFRQVSGAFYLGAGYHLDHHSLIEDLSLDTAASPPVITSHYAYSKAEGFDPDGYVLSGFSLDALYESRDHTLNPYRGAYVQLGYRVNPTWLGSSRNSALFHGEARTYLPLSTTRPRHLVAFWLMYDKVASGKVPYLDLPAIGYDTRGRTGRGFPAGRFRGTELAYGEVEYRFPLTRNGVLGGVAFLNATTAARPPLDDAALGVHDPGVKLFSAVKPAGGVGLRVAVDRRARMNVVVDVGYGAGGATALYLAMGEAF